MSGVSIDRQTLDAQRVKLERARARLAAAPQLFDYLARAQQRREALAALDRVEPRLPPMLAPVLDLLRVYYGGVPRGWLNLDADGVTPNGDKKSPSGSSTPPAAAEF